MSKEDLQRRIAAREAIVPTPESKRREREEIASDVAAFLEQGGNIRHVPVGVGVGVMTHTEHADMMRNTGFMGVGFESTPLNNSRGYRKGAGKK